MISSTNPESTVAATADPSGVGHSLDAGRGKNIHDIEPYLKWAAVAYGGGFATILVHTAMLGVPVIQVLDPLNVWIGFPIALSLYFVDKWIDGILKISAEIALSAKRVKLEDDPTGDQRNVAQLYDELISAYASLLSLTVFIPEGLTIWLAHRIFPKKVILPRLFASSLDNKAVGFMRRVATMTSGGATAIKRSIDLLSMCIALPFILGLYIFAVYPLMPQPWGGGKPMQVQLIVETDKLPPELPQLAMLFDASTGQSNVPATEQKARSTAVLRLRFQSEHSYLVQLQNGPVVSVSKEAVSAVLFKQ